MRIIGVDVHDFAGALALLTDSSSRRLYGSDLLCRVRIVGAEMAMNHPALSNKTASSLLYRLFVLEDTRKKLAEEMQSFAEKANEDVQLFFQTATVRSSPDCTHVLQALEAKCNIIERVYDFFQKLKTDPEAHSLIPVKSKNLEFGPMFHNLAVSVRSAVPSLGSACTIPQELSTQTSHVKEDVCDTSSECQECKIQAEDGQEMLHSFTKMKSHCDSRASVENPILPPSNEKLNHGIMQLDVQDVDKVFVMKHQKQTSSELRRFLQMNCKNDTAESIFSQEKDQSSSLNPVNGKPQDWTSKERNNCKKTPFHSLSSFVPVFKVQQYQSENLVRLNYMVLTDSEVWDIGDIPIQEHLPTTEKSGVESQEVPKMEGKIPAFPVRKYEEIEVAVSHVVDPANFYIQRVGSELQQMSARIELGCSGTFAQMRCIPDIGAKVVGWFPRDKLWCRVQVLRICGMKGEATLSSGSSRLMENIAVEVRRIDFGDTECLSLQSIKELDDLMATVPLQALQVSLANVSPANGQAWSTEAVHWFKDKVNSRVLYARVFPQETQVAVELFMEKGKTGVMR